MSSTAESANRTARAIRLIGIIDEVAIGPFTAADLDTFTENTWRRLAAADNGRPISTATRAAVAAILAARQTLPADPFAGLPS